MIRAPAHVSLALLPLSLALLACGGGEDEDAGLPDAGAAVDAGDADGGPGDDAGTSDAGAPDGGAGVCGDGVLDPLESCDDGNTTPGDGCPADCVVEGLYTVRRADGMLRFLDLETLELTDVGQIEVGFEFGGLTWDDGSRTLWLLALTDALGAATTTLHQVDPATGVTSSIGVTGVDHLFGLVLDPRTDRLLAVRGSSSLTGLYEIDPATGVATMVGPTSVPLDGLTYDSSRTQVVAMRPFRGELYEVDASAGGSTLIASGGTVDLDDGGIAYDPERDVIWVLDASGFFGSYDPDDGYARMTVTLDLGTDSHDGLTYAPFVPAP